MIYSRRRFAIGLVASLAFSGLSRAKESLPLDAGSLKTGVIVRGTGYEGVIFDASEARLIRSFVDGDVHGFWTPSEGDVVLFERNLWPALEAGIQEPDILSPTEPDRVYRRVLPQHLRTILERLPNYRRQYFGVVGSNDVKRLFVSLFPASAEDNTWTRRYVFVFDGGTSYWRIQFDLASQRFLHFNTNGFA
jgi:hypothetical protein